MENNPFINQDEEDKAKAAKAELDDDDDDEEEAKNKKHVHSRAPGIFFEKVKPEEKKRLSITDRFLESIGAKPEQKDDDKEKEKEKEKPEYKDQETTDEVVGGTLPPEVYAPVVLEDGGTVAVNHEATPVTQDIVSEKPLDTKALEAADWEAEVVPNKSKVEKIELTLAEPKEDFVEIPTPSEVEEETEIGPVEPELLEVGLGSEGPPEPPENAPNTTKADEPVPNPASSATTSSSPNTGYGGWAGNVAPSPWYNAAAAERARQEELDDAENEGRRAGIHRGIGSGLLFGWLFGRHGKKKQAKAFEKQLKSRDEEIRSLKTEQVTAKTNLEAVKRTQEQLQSNMQEQAREVSKGPENAPQKASASELATANAALKALERSTASMGDNEEIHQVADGRRVETSVWHRIEIDKKTGKVVKNPEVAYGEEFRLEQKEVYKDNQFDADNNNKLKKVVDKVVATQAHSAVQLGGLAAASYAQDDTAYDSDNQELGLAARLPSLAETNDYAKGSRILRFAAAPIIWAVAIVVVIVLFVAGILR